MTLDPTKIRIESHQPPIWEREESFQDIMNEQLKHAPWLGLSILIHVIALLLMIMLIPPTDVKDPKLVIQAQPEEEEEDIEEEEEEPPEEEPEEIEEEEVQEEEITETDESPTPDGRFGVVPEGSIRVRGASGSFLQRPSSAGSRYRRRALAQAVARQCIWDILKEPLG